MIQKGLALGVVLGVVVGLLTAGGMLLLSSWRLTAADNYSAVFLANGQTYFGQVVRQTGRSVMIANVHYLRPTADTNPKALKENSQSVELVRLGNELHRPTSTMIINRDHILFTEVLADDSPVAQQMKAIQ